MNKIAIELNNRELLDSIRRMAYLAQYRQPNILEHIERIRRYCFVIAKGLGLSSDEIFAISYASQLHDIGEIGVPEAIATKSGELTAYEWEVVKRHTLIGAQILKDAPSAIMQVGETIALTHHERWDGSGYPKGLRGEEIPLSGRVCALADVFDALTTKRPYKDGVLTCEEALILINDSSGQMFDPDLVEVFKENFTDILKIRTSQADEKRVKVVAD